MELGDLRALVEPRAAFFAGLTRGFWCRVKGPSKTLHTQVDSCELRVIACWVGTSSVFSQLSRGLGFRFSEFVVIT